MSEKVFVERVQEETWQANAISATQFWQAVNAKERL